MESNFAEVLALRLLLQAVETDCVSLDSSSKRAETSIVRIGFFDSEYIFNLINLLILHCYK